MVKFSERIGAVTPVKALQIDDMNDALRNSLWNLLYSLYDDNYWQGVARHVAEFFRKIPVDDLPIRDYQCSAWLKQYFYSLPWHQAYDLVEFIVNHHVRMTVRRVYEQKYYHSVSPAQLIERINNVLEQELSAYRFIAGVLSPIADATEIAGISTAVELAAEKGLHGARAHLRIALVQLGKKPEPDYRNCIKEAISAVESVAKQISGSKSKGLDGALEELSKVTNIHGALKAGFKSLYGYTSDENGIRHAILEAPSVGFAEAKYMLIACSSFVYYLIQKADHAHLLK